MALAVGAGIAGGSALISGYFANQAAGQQADAERAAAATQMQIYQQQRQDLQPYMQAGYSALGQIQANLPQWNKPFTAQDFLSNQDPGYQWRLSQGENAINRAAANSGGAVGASALQSLGNYSQGAASQEYQAAFDRYQQQINNSYNRLANVAGMGQGAVNAGIGAGTQAGQGMASALSNIGSAQAAGDIATGKGISSGITGGLNYYQGQQLVSALSANPNAPANPYAGAIQPGATGGFSNSALSQLSNYNMGPSIAPPMQPGAAPLAPSQEVAQL